MAWTLRLSILGCHWQKACYLWILIRPRPGSISGILRPLQVHFEGRLLWWKLVSPSCEMCLYLETRYHCRDDSVTFLRAWCYQHRFWYALAHAGGRMLTMKCCNVWNLRNDGCIVLHKVNGCRRPRNDSRWKSLLVRPLYAWYTGEKATVQGTWSSDFLLVHLPLFFADDTLLWNSCSPIQKIGKISRALSVLILWVNMLSHSNDMPSVHNTSSGKYCFCWPWGKTICFLHIGWSRFWLACLAEKGSAGGQGVYYNRASWRMSCNNHVASTHPHLTLL